MPLSNTFKNGTIHTIENRRLRVTISSLGGELQSVTALRDEPQHADAPSADCVGRGRERSGVEYLWQGDPAYWSDRAINIFPYIGRLTDGMYRHRGRTYEMDIHGFLKDTDMDVTSKSDDSVTYRMTDTDATRRYYPFSFALELSYRLDSDRLYTMFRVYNTGDEDMYFGLGGHPGFRVPVAGGEAFDDYFLEFPAAKNVTQILMSDACLTTGETRAFPLDGENDNRLPPGGKEHLVLPLRHDLFDRDAIVLGDTGGRVALKSRRSDRGVDLAYLDMKYLGLWHTPRTDAPFVCIEPWTSLPSRDGVIEELSEQENLITLAAGGEYRNTWSITLLR
jgi:galactose mutarotase-like enzyme